MELNVEWLAARWVLGLMPGSELASVATQALVEGYDGPAIRFVAGTVNPTLRDVSGQFERVLEELNAPRPSRSAAALLLVKDYAARIVDGSINPYHGARKIWTELSHELEPGDHTADPFIYYAAEFEETRNADERQRFEVAIIESARELVNA